MKTLKVMQRILGIKFLLVLFLLFFIRCEDRYLEEPTEPDPIAFSNEEAYQLSDFLSQIDLESGVIMVEDNGSIQDAVHASMPGDVIYIAPGIYRESITINKPNVTLVGLSSSVDEVVILENPKAGEPGLRVTTKDVQLRNIIVKNFEEKEGTSLSLKSSPLQKGRRCITMARHDLGGKIAHYTFDVPMGEDQFDVIRIHRVIREYRPFRPVHTQGDIFMVHGAIQDFDDIFLTAGADVINEETSAPYYLASKNIDVWGIDLAWTKVPVETTDFTFMKEWGLERDIDHTLKAMAIARLIRGFTKQGFCKMNLLGFSYGVCVAYGAAGRETRIHPVCRDVKGIIPVDSQIKFENEEKISNHCAEADRQMALINGGKYQDAGGTGLIGLGTLALNAPDDPSPVPDFTGLTNLQVMNAIGSDHSGGWHFFGGTPFELYYTDPFRFVQLAVSLAPFMPRLTLYEMVASACPAKEVSFDDYLEEIQLPILYISAEGGDGPIPDYTGNLTQSTDISRLHVKDPAREIQFNIGHADLWMAYDAKDFMWKHLCDWLVDHNSCH